MDVALQTTGVLRQRGQFTIPDQVREFLEWLVPNAIISITVRKNKTMTLGPYIKDVTSAVDWKNIWERIEIADSFQGKQGNLSQFIIDDRDKRR